MQRNADLRALLDAFSGKRVALIGDLAADEYVYGETDRISREAPVLIVRFENSEVKLGCAGNVAANLAALGAHVLPVALVGDDEPGARLRAVLDSIGVDTAGVLSAPDCPTAKKTRVLAGGKNTRRQQMIRIDRDGPGAPPAALLGRLLRAVRDAAAEADAVLVSDYGLGLLAPPVIEAILRLAAQGRTVCVDARYGLSQYRGVTVAKPNEVELEQVVGRPLGGELSVLEEAGRELLRTLRAGSLLVTRGRSGMVLMRPGAPAMVLPVHGSPTAVDVTGAGDTVFAAHGLGLAAGGDSVQAARLANVVASLVVQKPGTATASVAEVRRELARSEVARPEPLEGAQEPARKRRARR